MKKQYNGVLIEVVNYFAGDIISTSGEADTSNDVEVKWNDEWNNK